MAPPAALDHIETAGETAKGEASPTASEGEKDSGKTSGPFGGLSPQEAGRRRQAKAREEQASAPDDRDTDAAIVRKLRQKAARGDVPAARELREWQARDPASDAGGDEWLGLLTQGERAAMRALMRHVRARKLGQVEGEWPGVPQLAP